MSESLLIIITLGVLNVLQFAFWSWQNQMLVNKLMCRDFTEYKLNTTKPVKEIVSVEDDLAAEAEEQEVLAELNGMLPKHTV